MRYRFGQCELATSTRELLFDGQLRKVEPQVFDLLCHLVKERERIISQKELVDVVWKGRAVSDSAIHARISAARSTIGDDGARQQWIRTIPRRGFRFVGAVEAVSPVQPETAPAQGATQGRGATNGESRRQRIAICRSADGTAIAWATSGHGEPLVKVGHWLTHLEHDWRSPLWQPFLDRLGQRFRVVRHDLRGTGLSDWDVTDFTLERFVEDLEAVVEAAGLDRFALYGTSQGVPIAIAYACRHPERVSKLVLHGGYSKGRLLHGSGTARLEAEAFLALVRQGWGKPDSPFIRALAILYIPDGCRRQIESLAELQRKATSPDNALLLREAVDRFDVSDLLEKLSVPTLVIHARDDGIHPLEEGRKLASRIRHAEFCLLESRNHIVLEHDKAWPLFFSQLERFILD